MKINEWSNIKNRSHYKSSTQTHKHSKMERLPRVFKPFRVIFFQREKYWKQVSCVTCIFPPPFCLQHGGWREECLECELARIPNIRSPHVNTCSVRNCFTTVERKSLFDGQWSLQYLVFRDVISVYSIPGLFFLGLLKLHKSNWQKNEVFTVMSDKQLSRVLLDSHLRMKFVQLLKCFGMNG